MINWLKYIKIFKIFQCMQCIWICILCLIIDKHVSTYIVYKSILYNIQCTWFLFLQQNRINFNHIHLHDVYIDKKIQI